VCRIDHSTARDRVRDRSVTSHFSRTLDIDLDAASRLMDRLAALGIDVDDVGATLRERGRCKLP